MKYIVFDFNGTILDDAEVTLKCLNKLIVKYLHEDPIDMAAYLEVFDFPVQDYYEKLGFDFEVLDYDLISKEFMDLYESYKDEYQLMDGIIDLLEDVKKKGYEAYILSASEKKRLKIQCDELKISGYFKDILGTDNIKGGLKSDIALKFIKDKDPKDGLMIGDTLADLKIAELMGVKCLLLADSHQSKRRLREAHDEVYDSLKEIKECIK